MGDVSTCPDAGEEVLRLRTEVEDRRAELDGSQQFIKTLTGMLYERCRELDRLREDARRVYGADGSSELLNTPEEVVRLRVEMAGKLERQERLLIQLRDLLREAGP